MTILLVEDDPHVRILVDLILRKGGYRTLCAGDGEEALAVLDAHDGPIDLLLTDVILPCLSGRALAECLTARMPDLKVLYMSGYNAESLRRRGAIDQISRLIEKPFAPATLAREVRDAIAAREEFATTPL